MSRHRWVLEGEVSIRLATCADADAVERLAQLEGRRTPEGAVLVAFVAGHPLAALPLDGGPPLADPFRPTAHLVRLLELRAAELAAGERAGAAAPVVPPLVRPASAGT